MLKAILDTGNFEKKLLTNQTLPVVILAMNLRIDSMIVLIGVSSQTLSTPAMKEVVADAELGGAWVTRSMRHVSRTGIN